MSQISNRFFVTALEDGTTLHGNLASDKSLSQAWTGAAAVPDWRQSANQPTIYLTLLSSTELVQPKNNYKWLYNGVEIVFGNDNISTSPSGMFQKTTKSVTYGNITKTMPALKIIDNLASIGNVDVDMIGFQGEYAIGSGDIPFSCDAQVRISTITGNGYIGVINFVGGISDITAQNQTITMYGVLYDSSGGTVQGATTKWYINDSTTGVDGSTITAIEDGVQKQFTNAYQVTEANVVDHATIRCEFYSASTRRYTAYAGVDDMQDPEFMYIQYNGANGNAASLRSGDSVTFYIWVGTREDASVIGGSATPLYNSIGVKLLDGDGVEITGVLPDINDRGADGYRPLTMSGGKGSITIRYTVVYDNKKNITGIVLAKTS